MSSPSGVGKATMVVEGRAMLTDFAAALPECGQSCNRCWNCPQCGAVLSEPPATRLEIQKTHLSRTAHLAPCPCAACAWGAATERRLRMGAAPAYHPGWVWHRTCKKSAVRMSGHEPPCLYGNLLRAIVWRPSDHNKDEIAFGFERAVQRRLTRAPWPDHEAGDRRRRARCAEQRMSWHP